MHGDVIGLAALDLVLRDFRARVVRMALVVHVPGMDAQDRATDAAGLGVPTHAVPDLEALSHRRGQRVRPWSAEGCGPVRASRPGSPPGAPGGARPPHCPTSPAPARATSRRTTDREFGRA